MSPENLMELDTPAPGSRCMGIVLGTKLKKRLTKLAKEEDRSLSSLIRTLIIEALTARNK